MLSNKKFNIISQEVFTEFFLAGYPKIWDDIIYSKIGLTGGFHCSLCAFITYLGTP